MPPFCMGVKEVEVERNRPTRFVGRAIRPLPTCMARRRLLMACQCQPSFVRALAATERALPPGRVGGHAATAMPKALTPVRTNRLASLASGFPESFAAATAYMRRWSQRPVHPFFRKRSGERPSPAGRYHDLPPAPRPRLRLFRLNQNPWVCGPFCNCYKTARHPRRKFVHILHPLDTRQEFEISPSPWTPAFAGVTDWASASVLLATSQRGTSPRATAYRPSFPLSRESIFS